jgi:hypothetical protein
MPRAQDQGGWTDLSSYSFTHAMPWFQCDETLPECSQCLEAGWKCPGSVSGLIFISMNKSRQPLRAASKASSRGSGERPGDSSEGIRHIGELELLQSHSRSGSGFNLPPAAKPLVAGAAEQCFIGCFMSSYHTAVVQWPSRPIENPTTMALKFSVRAGTMAFYGNLTKNATLQVEASRWYSKAIQLEMSRLSGKASGRKKTAKSVNPETLLTPMTLALFESALCTSPMGWAHHLNAAAKQLEVLGPEKCQTGAMHGIFRSVRLNMVSRHLGNSVCHSLIQSYRSILQRLRACNVHSRQRRGELFRFSDGQSCQLTN